MNLKTIQPDETSLIKAAQTGDAAAFESLVEAHYDQMYRFALKYSGDKSEAEDITHQACLKLAKSLRQFRFEAAFSTWLYRLVINCAHDWYRAKPQTSDSVEEMVEESNPAQSLVLLRQTLQRIEQMGAGFREAVTLVLGEGRTHSEAAVLLGVKESTVSWRIHEVRKKLAKTEAES